MQVPRIRFLITLFLCATFSPGCGKAAVDEIGYGEFSGSSYRNDYFGLTMDIPDGWSTQGEAARKRLMARGNELVGGDDTNLKARLRAADSDVVNLFIASEHPFGAPVDSNPCMTCVAERVSHMPGVKSGADYLFHARKLFKSSQVDVSFPQSVYPKRLDDVEFHVMTAVMKVNGQSIRQEYYSTVLKGYAFNLISAFTDDAERETLRASLATVRFAYE